MAFALQPTATASSHPIRTRRAPHFDSFAGVNLGFLRGRGCCVHAVRPGLRKKSRFVRAMAVDAQSDLRRVEVVYYLDQKLNMMADEMDGNAGISRLNLFSPCKINLFLRITGKREDGFHELASLFPVISLGDTIKFSLSPSKKDRLSTNVPGVPVDDKNLIIKAFNLYRQKTGSNKYFRIHLDKKVPTGAGGSSNAATALWAVNQFSSCPVTEKQR